MLWTLKNINKHGDMLPVLKDNRNENVLLKKASFLFRTLFRVFLATISETYAILVYLKPYFNIYFYPRVSIKYLNLHALSI